MNARRPAFEILCLLIVLFLSSCRPDITITPTLTWTPIPSSTLLPTITPDPLMVDISHAANLADSGDTAGAIALYSQVLQEATDKSIHDDAFYGLLAIAAEAHYQAIQDVSMHCSYDATAVAAYEPLLQASNPPDTDFYANAAEAESDVIACRTGLPDSNQIYQLLEKMALFPPEAEGLDGFFAHILSGYRYMATHILANQEQDIRATGDAIQAQIGERIYKGKTVSKWVEEILMGVTICGQPAIPSSTLGTSPSVKVFSCNEGYAEAVSQAGLAASSPEEIHFALRYDWIGSGDTNCVGTVLETGKTFAYHYPNSWIEAFSLVDVHTGQVVSTKEFPSTVPRCVYTYCSVDPVTNTGVCEGGQGLSTIDQSVLVRWLEEVVK